MHWAIVVGGTPSAPIVRYLTLPPNIKDAGKEHRLKANSYVKLDTPFEIGSNVVFPDGKYWRMGTILNETNDRYLLLSSRKLTVVPKVDARAVPAHPGDLKVGQRVHVAKLGQVGQPIKNLEESCSDAKTLPLFTDLKVIDVQMFVDDGESIETTHRVTGLDHPNF